MNSDHSAPFGFIRFIHWGSLWTIASLYLGVACGDGRDNEPGSLGPPTMSSTASAELQNPPAIHPHEGSSATKLFDALEQACHMATGHGLSEDHQCFCGSDASTASTRTVFSTSGSHPECRPLSLTTRTVQCLHAANGFSIALGAGDPAGTEALQRCLDGVGGVGRFSDDVTLGGTRVSLVLPHGSVTTNAHTAQAVARWADEHLAQKSLRFGRLWSSFAIQDFVNVYVGQVGERQLSPILDTLMVQRFLSNSPSTTPPTLSVVEPTVDALADVLGMIPISPDRHRQLFKPPPGSSEPDADTRADLWRAYETLIRRSGAVPVFEDATILAGAGCTDLCRVRTRPIVLPSLAGSTLERVYIHGSVAREVISVERHGARTGLMLLGPAQVPGLIVTFEHTVLETSATTVIRAYDRTWNDLGRRALARGPRYAQLRDLLRSRTEQRNDPSRRLIVCEQGFSELRTAPDVLTNIAFGPSTPVFDEDGTLIRGSLFGWFQNPRGQIGPYVRGYAPLIDGFFPYNGSSYDVDHWGQHANAVARAALTQNPGLRIVPIGATDCFDFFREWFPAVTEAKMPGLRAPKAHVANVSFSMTMDRQECNVRAGEPIRASGASLLWVVAGGSDGSPAYECPRSLVGEDNLIIVMDGDSSGLAARPNADYHYTDIVARGMHPTRGAEAEGASFAAPRVAAEAVALAAEFPNLTSQDIKLALLASSWTAPPLTDTVRSGGVLDSEGAKRVARCFAATKHDESNASRTPVETQQCLRSTGFSESFIHRKLQLLARPR